MESINQRSMRRVIEEEVDGEVMIRRILDVVAWFIHDLK